MKTIRIIFITILCLLATEVSFAQDGWNKTKENDALVYIPTDIKEGKIFMITVPAPVNLNGQDLKEWFTSEAQAQQAVLGEPIQPWQVKPEKDGAWGISNSFTNSSGEKMTVGYQGGYLEDGRAYILQLVSGSDIGILLKYGMQLNRVLKDAESTFIDDASLIAIASSSTKKPEAPIKNTTSKKKSKITTRDKVKAIEKAIRTAPGQGARLSDIEAIWIYSHLDVLWGGIDVTTYVLFNDGSAYEGCEIPPMELDVKKSRELQVAGDVYKYGKWTVWRKSGNGYQIKDLRDGSWEKLDGNEAIPAKPNEKLNAKFITAGGSQMSGSWKNHITLKPNGTFEMSSFSMQGNSAMGGGDTGPSVTVVRKSDKEGTSGTTVVAGGDVGGGTSSKKKDGSKNTGTYSLNGYTITLKHENGWEHTELFFFDESDKKSFIYKEDSYWVDED